MAPEETRLRVPPSQSLVGRVVYLQALVATPSEAAFTGLVADVVVR